jgi:hypothetical protein
MLCLAALAGCAAPRLSNTADEVALATEVRAPGLLFDIQYLRADGEEAARIEAGLLAAGPRLRRWGSFRHGVKVRILPDHEALESRIGLHGYPWLRAWAFGEQILLQSPRTWGEPSASAQQELSELLAHELTHALMYQLLQPAEGSQAEEPPLWFREGMASVTADQGHRRVPIDELRLWQQSHAGADLLHPTPELYRTEKEAVYGAAHRAFERLVALFGDQAVRKLLRAVRSGGRFGDAFVVATGQPLALFEAETLPSHFSAMPFHSSLPAVAGGP